jgi:hypothetical protein
MQETPSASCQPPQCAKPQANLQPLAEQAHSKEKHESQDYFYLDL